MTEDERAEHTNDKAFIQRLNLQAILKWFGIVGLWTISVALVAALFAGEDIGALVLIALTADIFGITTGTLGIYFYFQADSLNQRVGSQTQEIMSIVGRLEGRMWDIFERNFVKGDPNIESVQQALREIGNKLEEAPAVAEVTRTEMRGALSVVEKYIDRIEEWHRVPARNSPAIPYVRSGNRVLQTIERLRAQVSLGKADKQELISEIHRLIGDGEIPLEELPSITRRLGLKVDISRDTEGSRIEVSIPNDTS